MGTLHSDLTEVLGSLLVSLSRGVGNQSAEELELSCHPLGREVGV